MKDPVTVQNIIEQFKKELAEYYPPREIEGLYYLVFEHILNYSKIDIHLNKDSKIEENRVKKILELLEELKTHRPIQYILGETEFYELTFKVDEHTLIPRPETEELVLWILQENRLPAPTVLDIGTGSGCIPIALAKHLPKAEVMSVDVSEGALRKARENADLNQVNIQFEQRNILHWEKYEWPTPFDIIVSNPPYVRESEKRMMDRNVLDYEPEGALYVSDEDPLIFYRTIAEFALSHLRATGTLYFEINEYLGPEMVHLLETMGFTHIRLKKDINDRDRMIAAQLL